MADMDQIYRQYMVQIYKYLFSLCHNQHLAEELTQETFFQALKSINNFRGECKLYVWLCQIAKRVWIKDFEKKKREKNVEINDNIPSPQGTVENDLILHSEKMSLFKKMHSLPEQTKEVMYLRLSGEFSFREIGEIMGKDETWARVTYYRGRQKLREENRDEM